MVGKPGGVWGQTKQGVTERLDLLKFLSFFCSYLFFLCRSLALLLSAGREGGASVECGRGRALGAAERALGSVLKTVITGQSGGFQGTE